MKKRNTSGRKGASRREQPGSLDGETTQDLADIERAAAAEDSPDRDVVDEIGAELGVARRADEEFRPSSEILEQRDRRRLEQEE
jgi:hypothetical protein